MYALSKQFVTFQSENSFFVKRMGDGIMCVIELTENKSINQSKIISLIDKVKRLNLQITETILNMDFPRPIGFRSRVVAGDALKLESRIRGRLELDYVGYPVNLAFNLLNVKSQIPFMAHETVKSILDTRPHSIKAMQIQLDLIDYKGVDKEDLTALWDFELTS